MGQKRELAKNTLILAVGKLSTQFVSLLLVPLYTFFLAPAEYGFVDLVVTYVLLLAPVATLQLEMASFRYLVDARADEAAKKRIISNVMHVVFAAILLLVVAYVVAGMFVVMPYGPLILAIAAVTILLNLFLQMVRGLGKNKEYAYASIAIALANILATLGFVVFAQLGVQGVFMAMLIANAAGLVYLFLKLRLYKYITFRQQDIGLKKELVRYALPLIPNGISWWVISLFDRTVIALFLGVAANGIYAVSSKYATIFTSLASIFGMSWTESASMHINSKDRHVFFNDVFNASVRAFGSLGLLLIAALPFVFGAIGAQYAESYLYVPILIIAAFFNAMVGLYSAIYVARKMTKQVMTTSLIAAAINIALNIALITFIGLYAAALATATAYLAMAVYRHYDIKSYLHIVYKKRVLLGLALLYGFVVYLYYMNNPVVNVLNALLVIGAALYINRHVMGVVTKRFRRQKVGNG